MRKKIFILLNLILFFFSYNVVYPQCVLDATISGDPSLCSGSTNLTVNLTGESSCAGSETLALFYDLDDCVPAIGTVIETPAPASSPCYVTIEQNSFGPAFNENSCVSSYGAIGAEGSPSAICTGGYTGTTFPPFAAEKENLVGFTLRVYASALSAAQLSTLSFYVKGTSANFEEVACQQMGVQIAESGGTPVHQLVSGLAVPRDSWLQYTIDLTTIPELVLSSTTQYYDFTFKGYDPDGALPYTDPAGNVINLPVFDLDQIRLYYQCMGSSNTTFSWSGPSGFSSSQQDITVSTSGTYSVTATDCLGCTATDNIYVDPCTPTPSTITGCSGSFFDTGGSLGSYSNNEDYEVTYCSGTTESLTMTFTSFDIENEASCSYDKLLIYDGSSTSASLIGTYCGTNSPGSITSSGTCLHFRFISDNSQPASGWEAAVSCGSGSGGGGSTGTICEQNFGIVQPGQIVATCGATNQTDYVMGVMDITPLTYNSSSQMPSDWHHANWTVQSIGNIYFTEFGPDGSIYAPASFFTMSNWGEFGGLNTVWQYGTLGGGANDLNAAGSIYKMDAITGNPTVWARLPQQLHSYLGSSGGSGTLPSRTAGPGLGGITYDVINNNIYIVNMEDGKIYVFNANDTGPFPLTSADAIDIFDPMLPDNGATGMPPLGDRPFGLDIYDGRLYYTVHDRNTSTGDGMLIVRSVGISAAGINDATDQLEISQTISYPNNISEYVVADIEISDDGRIAVGGFSTYSSSYYFSGIPNVYNHAAGVYVFDLNGTRLKFSSVGQYTFQPGDASTSGTTNYTSTGGVAWNACNAEDILWMSGGDFLGEDSDFGIIGYEYNSLNNIEAIQETSNSYIQFVFAQDNPTVDQKGNGGDVDVFNFASFCVCDVCEVTASPSVCNASTNTYSVTGNITFNNSPTTGILTVSIGTQTQTFSAPFNSPQSYTINGLTADGTSHLVTASFSANASCTNSISYVAPSSCTVCNLNPISTSETCNSNGTNSDPSDDYISFSLNPSGSNLSSSYSVTSNNGGIVSLASGGSATGISYGSATSFRLQNGSANGITVYSITITDTGDPSCSITTSVNQSSCSNSCNLPTATITAMQATCNGATANNDAYLQIVAATDATHYNFVEGSTYATGDTDITNAIAFDPMTDLPLLLSNLSNPSGSKDYTFRIFNAQTNCFADIVVTLNETVCDVSCVPIKCPTIIITKNN